MVGIDLEGSEDGGHDEAPQIFPSVGQHDTGYHRGQISQCPYLPDVPRCNDDEEVGGEGPDDGAQHGQMLTEVEGAQQDVEAQQVGKHVPYVLWQPQMVGIGQHRQVVGGVVRGRHLIRRHAREEGIGPPGTFSCALIVLHGLLAGTAPG